MTRGSNRTAARWLAAWLLLACLSSGLAGADETKTEDTKPAAKPKEKTRRRLTVRRRSRRIQLVAHDGADRRGAKKTTKRTKTSSKIEMYNAN